MTKLYVDIHTHTPSFGSDVVTPSSYGVHPWRAEEFSPLDLDTKRFKEVECIGEIGLDYSRDIDREQQQRLFEAQLEIAQELNKIVIIHCVRAFNQTISTLSKYTLAGVIFHGFIGSSQLMTQLTKLGYYISYGERTTRSRKTIEALRATPREKLFLERDQSPLSIAQIYGDLAVIMGIEVEELKGYTYDNYKKILDI